MRLFTILLIVFILFSYNSLAQSCTTIPGMTPGSSIPVCGTTTFTQNTIASCTGPDIPTSCVSALVSSNSAWYGFHCYQTGLLSFTITPQSPTDDYDWTVFDVTGIPVTDVYTNQGTQISVNLCGFTGATGASAAGITNVNCEGNTNLWNQPIPLQAGNDYLIMVTNWSNSGLGYNLTFTSGATTITTVAPVIDSIRTVGCAPSQIKVYFSKDILCNSVTAAGSEFVIMPGNIPATSVTSGCTTGATGITELTVNLQNPLPGGNYNLVVSNGSDGNTFRDACNQQVTPGTQIPFTIASQGAPVINTATFTGCAPNSLNITLSNAILCNTISASGSEFSISPGNPVITSVQTSCGTNPYTTTLQINLQSPLPFGNYQITINTGSDNNTFVDTCAIPIPAGYTYPFTISQATTAPVIQSVGFNECTPNKVVLNFDKPVTCNSLTAAGSEFSITPGSWPITSIASSCGTTTTNQVTLTLQNSLPAGNFNVNVNNGSDANTLSDTCFAFIPAGYTRPFVTTQAPLPVFDSVTLDKCNPAFIKVYYNHPIKCSSISANGSEFNITGPSAVTITAATTNTTCTQGYTNWIQLQLSQPINTVGNYVLHNATGSDTNGIIDTCNASQNTAETIAFNVLVKPDATFTNIVHWGCSIDTIDVAHPGGNAVNSWTWTFSNGGSITTQSGSQQFPVSTVNAGIQLIVSNGSCSDTANVTIPLNNAFNAAFTPGADTTCIGKPVSFTNISTGTNLSHNWQMGDNTTFNGPVPPPHTYTINNPYTVTLITTDSHGCKDTASSNIYATALPVISYSGLNNQYCTREQVSLTANLQGNIDNYTWTNGNGSTTQNVPSVNYTYTQENNYTITLSANDRFCGITTYKDTAIVYLVPVVDLGKDTMLCPQMRLQLGYPDNTNLIYLWSTGATTSQIITHLTTDTYHLLVDNHGCTGEGSIKVEMLDGCLIRVPGAFTPNNDGRNDRLKAINAFIATNFSLRVYNRYGQLMFQTTNPLDGWDGRFKGQDEGPGTYVWQLSYVDPWSHQPVFQKGTSILIR